MTHAGLEDRSSSPPGPSAPAQAHSQVHRYLRLRFKQGLQIRNCGKIPTVMLHALWRGGVECDWGHGDDHGDDVDRGRILSIYGPNFTWSMLRRHG